LAKLLKSAVMTKKAPRNKAMAGPMEISKKYENSRPAKEAAVAAARMRSKHTFWDLSSPSIMTDI